MFFAASPKAEWLIGQTDNGNVVVFDPASGQEVTEMQAVTEGPGGISFHPTQNIVAVWGKSRQIIILH
jgi:DNA-binding beta-propeller fold protein YncE